MAKSKVTITLDRGKAEQAGRLIGSPTVSATIDTALDRLVRQELTRLDVEAYLRNPQTDEERSLGDTPVHLDLDDDDTPVLGHNDYEGQDG